MSTEVSELEVANIPIRIVRKDIKHIHLAVYPPDGGVRMSAPQNKTDEELRLYAISKLPWIKENIKQFEHQERLPERDYIPGESHYYLGKRYLLDVKSAKNKHEVRIRGKKYLELYVQNPEDKASKKRLLDKWYRERLRDLAPDFIQKWENNLGVELKEWQIKRMTTKWGSCNHDAKRIWLNLHLIKKPLEVIDYVILHEMTHLVERNHTDRFNALLDKHMPDWRYRRDELNALIYEE